MLGSPSIVQVILPGFKFHPTDEELLGFYLQRKVQNRSLPLQIIPCCDVFNCDPWELPQTSACGENNVWYFFCPRDQKYRQGLRPNKVTKCGYWKATGPDRPIFSKDGVNCLGLKKCLVFYKGKAAKAVKTDWGMHEFRLPAIGNHLRSAEECWSVCRIFRKRCPTRRPKSNDLDTDNALDLSNADCQEKEQQQSLEGSPESERETQHVEFFNFLEEG